MRSSGGGGGNSKRVINGSNSFLLPDQALSGLSAISSLNPAELRSSSRLSSNVMHSPSKHVDTTITKGGGIKGVAIPPHPA